MKSRLMSSRGKSKNLFGLVLSLAKVVCGVQKGLLFGNYSAQICLFLMKKEGTPFIKFGMTNLELIFTGLTR